MDNFVDQLRTNIKINPEMGKGTKSSRLREILHLISVSSPEINIVEGCNEDGDVIFEVSMRTLGITHELLSKYRKEICSEFMANFFGELLVRENLSQFVNILTNIHPEQYSVVVGRFEHRKFGMDICRDNLVFRFHISLLQDILLEDIKRKVR